MSVGEEERRLCQKIKGMMGGWCDGEFSDGLGGDDGSAWLLLPGSSRETGAGACSALRSTPPHLPSPRAMRKHAS